MEKGIMQDVQVIAEEADSVELSPKARAVIAAVLVVIALLSFFVIAEFASSTETHASTISSLDAKKDTVMGLIGASTAASATISLLPGDAGTPIAEKFADLSSDFLIVITAIYLEKYLLTTLGFVAFKIIIPLACLVFAGALFIRGRPNLKQSLMRLASKLVLFGLAIFLVVPVSIGVSGMIESTYKDSVDQTIAAANKTTEEIASTPESATSESGASSPLEWFLGLPENVGNAVSDLADSAQKALDWFTATLNRFIEALAVMVVTSCIIPIAVLIFFLWLVKLILGVDVTGSMQMVMPRTMRRVMR